METTEFRGAGTTQFRTGWITFAAVLAGVAGAWNVLSGIAAIAEDDQTEALAEVLYGVDITVWGWFWLILGIVQLVIAWLIYSRSSVGLILGVIWAGITASLAVFTIFVAPLWSLAVLGLSVTVIWALMTNPDEFA